VGDHDLTEISNKDKKRLFAKRVSGLNPPQKETGGIPGGSPNPLGRSADLRVSSVYHG